MGRIRSLKALSTGLIAPLYWLDLKGKGLTGDAMVCHAVMLYFADTKHNIYWQGVDHLAQTLVTEPRKVRLWIAQMKKAKVIEQVPNYKKPTCKAYRLLQLEDETPAV